MKGTFFHLFVILFGLSHLLFVKAVPVTRTESLMQVPQLQLAPENIRNFKVMNGVKWEWEEPIIEERMDLELHDYPPSGANGRHTPRAP
ncbi:hypothetical protein RJT34_01318 [Clitoria ternatea]|uniref:Uncharacterized protein n=1 Tax=Clitoria ternatea TaxID=43366 RepID=A0AAN9Q389_CLITE